MMYWESNRITFGTEELREKIRNKKIGLMMNTSATDNKGRLLLDVIVEEKWADVLFFFGMEHGVRSNVMAGESAIGNIDAKTGIPVINLFDYPECRPPVEYVKQVDAVVFCAQDIGIRHWTFTPWMLKLIDAAAQADREVIILDRPNPLRGDIVEGEIAQKYVGESMVSGFEYPLRHGMTIGELALMYNETKQVGANLTILKMKGWTRDMWYDETGLFWLPLTPNVPTFETALYFGTTGLMQAANFSVGVGTTMPFQYVGSPHFSGDILAKELNSRNIDGVYFVQRYSKSNIMNVTGKVKQWDVVSCDGVLIIIADRNKYSPVTTQIHIMDAILKCFPEYADFDPAYKVPDAIGHLNCRERMCTDEVCEMAERKESLLPLIEKWKASSEEFMKRRKPFLLY